MRKLLFLLLVLAVPAAAAPNATVSVLPAQPIVEKGRGSQFLNCDFLIENPGDVKLELTTVEMSLFTADGKFIAQRRVQPNGLSVLTIPERYIEPGKKIVVFNPVPSIPDDIRFATAKFEFIFGDGRNDDVLHVSTEVKPREDDTKTALELPVRGRVFVHDGHDFLAHHRRLDITGDMTTALGIKTNMTRFAYDFVNVDEKGRMRKGESEANTDYYAFGQPIYAPGDGVVIKAADGVADNEGAARWKPDFNEVLKNLLVIGGNYIVLDHGNGEFSFIAHMKKDSVAVKVGDRVKRGQKVGEVGSSGDSMFPHLHYQLQSDDYLGEGLPSYFTNFDRLVGTKTQHVVRGQVDSGDVLVVKK